MQQDKGELAFENIDELLADRIIDHTKENTEKSFSVPPHAKNNPDSEVKPDEIYGQKKSNKTKYIHIVLVGFIITWIILFFLKSRIRNGQKFLNQRKLNR